jgi:HEAT repeat protein
MTNALLTRRTSLSTGLLAAALLAFPVLARADSALDAARAGLKSAKPQERLNALQQLGKMGAKAKKAVPDLVKLLDREPSPMIQFMTTLTLGKIGAVPELIRALGHRKPDVRKGAAVSLTLAGRRAKAAVPKLRKIIRQDPDMEFRLVAAASLFQIDPADPTAPLGAAACLDNPKVSTKLRVSAASVLARMGTKAGLAVPALTRALREDALKDAAVAALGAVGPSARSAAPHLVKILNPSRPITGERLVAVGSALCRIEPADGEVTRKTRTALARAFKAVSRRMTDQHLRTGGLPDAHDRRFNAVVGPWLNLAAEAEEGLSGNLAKKTPAQLRSLRKRLQAVIKEAEKSIPVLREEADYYFPLFKKAEPGGLKASYQGSVLARHDMIRDCRKRISRAKGRIAEIDELLKRKS